MMTEICQNVSPIKSDNIFAFIAEINLLIDKHWKVVESNRRFHYAMWKVCIETMLYCDKMYGIIC